MRNASLRLILVLTGASFLAYFCMYAFRKPFTVANFAGSYVDGSSVQMKTALVLSQLCGYAVSKFLGIRWCSGARRQHRAWWLVGCVLFAEIALVIFALVPPAWKPLAMFANGLPLGMVWGFVVAYLEGRRLMEILVAGLSCSFIIAGGVVKDAGTFVLRCGVSEMWMPACVGALFLGPFLFATWLLERAPEPSPEDTASRAPRAPMTAADRRRFLSVWLPTLVPLTLLYLLLTAFRDYRDNFGIEIFQQLGLGNESGLFTRAETPIALGVFAALVLPGYVKGNRRAVLVMFGLMGIGLVLTGAATWLHWRGGIGGFAWMSLSGLGSYLAYVPFGALLFDRLMAVSKTGGTALFAIYLADSIAYLGAVAVQLEHDLFFPSVTRLDFLQMGSVVVAAAGLLLLAIGTWHFLRETRWKDGLNTGAS